MILSQQNQNPQCQICESLYEYFLESSSTGAKSARSLPTCVRSDVENLFQLRDAIIKENPAKSGFLQIGGGGGLGDHPIQIFNM